MTFASKLVAPLICFGLGAAIVAVLRHGPVSFAGTHPDTLFAVESASLADLTTIGAPMSAPERRQFEAVCTKVLSRFPAPAGAMCSCLGQASEQTLSRFDRAVFAGVLGGEQERFQTYVSALEGRGLGDLQEALNETDAHLKSMGKSCKSHGSVSLELTHGPGR